MQINRTILKSILAPLIAFLLSTGVAFGVTTYLYAPESGSPISPVQTPPAGGKLNIDPSLPKTESCPVNGKMYTKIEKEIWESRRPLFVMIENSVEARPQSGLNEADVIYEAVAEGGITRFGAVYLCDVAAEDTIVGPVRSARTYFVNLASEYNYPLYTHVGGANCSAAPGAGCTTDKRVQALEQINDYGWGGSKGNDLNQFSIGYPTFWRDYERLGRTVATEHTMYSSTEKLFSFAKTRGWTNLSPKGEEWSDEFTSWQFKDDAKETDRGDISSVTFGFWEKYQDFQVVWTYDPASNSYKRTNGNAPHKDLNNDSQLEAKVVIIQLVREHGPLDDHKHMLYDVVGSGEGYIFQDGKAIEVTWSKPSRTARTTYKDAKGKSVDFNRGKIFIEIIPSDNKVDF